MTVGHCRIGPVVLISSWRGAALFAGTIASFLVVALEFGFHVGVAYASMGVLLCFDCIMGGYVGGCGWVFMAGVEAVDLGFDGLVATKHAFD